MTSEELVDQLVDAMLDPIHLEMRVRGLTQQQVARLAGMSQGQLGDLLNERYRPDLKTILRVARGLGITYRITAVQSSGGEGQTPPVPPPTAR